MRLGRQRPSASRGRGPSQAPRTHAARQPSGCSASLCALIRRAHARAGAEVRRTYVVVVIVIVIAGKLSLELAVSRLHDLP